MQHVHKRNGSLVRPHQGVLGGPQFDSGVGVLTVDEQKNKRKKLGLCPTCGKVKTHKPGLWKALMPNTIEGLVYKGICLNCSTLDAAKMLLGEPITGSPVPDDMARTNMRIVYHKEDFGGSMPAMKLMENNEDESSIATEKSQSEPNKFLTEKPQAVKRVRGESEGDDLSASMPLMKFMENNDTSTESGDLLRKISLDEMQSQGLKTQQAKSKDNNALSRRRHSNSTIYSIFAGNRESTRSTKLPGLKEEEVKSKKSDALPRRRQTGAPMSDSTIYSRSEEHPREWVESKKQSVKDFRCSDFGEDFGFYTGTVQRFNAGNKNVDLPNGRGQMVYDDGRIEKGVWTRGNLRIKVAPDRERYEPFLLPKYSIGDVGHNDDMVKFSAVDVSKLHVGDCAFIKRSGGTWSYAILKHRSDDDHATITFQIKRGSSKSIPIKNWAGHVRTPAKPDILPQYFLGDPGQDEDMIIESREETVKSVSKLKIGDAAFVVRSGSSWTYAIVKDRTIGDEAVITFQVNARGSTKVISVLQCGKFVRRVKQSNGEEVGLSDKEANAI